MTVNMNLNMIRPLSETSLSEMGQEGRELKLGETSTRGVQIQRKTAFMIEKGTFGRTWQNRLFLSSNF